MYGKKYPCKSAKSHDLGGVSHTPKRRCSCFNKLKVSARCPSKEARDNTQKTGFLKLPRT